MMEAETIAAIATSVGHAGIGIVRVSGPASREIARAVFRKKDGQHISFFEPRKLSFGIVVDPETGHKVDEALCVFMPGPNSYTAEDVIEFQGHGGPLVIRNILKVVLKQGARLALPGEFTQRAFLNGRIDLMQAEATMAVIQAKTDAALKNAAMQMSGDLSRRIKSFRSALMDKLVYLEASLDYPEEDISIPLSDEFAVFLAELVQEFDKLLLSAHTGKIYRDGLRTVIVGRPNVGKSTLLNALLGEERAIVTDVPGTTRDSIEEFLNIRGIPLQIVDTAGLRESNDTIEQLGMQRTREFIEAAGLILVMIDATDPFVSDDLAIIKCLPNVPTIIVINKMDLPNLAEFPTWKEVVSNHPVVALSAKERTGIEELENTIEKIILTDSAHISIDGCLDNLRQIDCVISAKDSVLSALSAIDEGLPLDCVAIDLRAAISSLGQITGETLSDEIVKEIFSKFCLGK